MNTTLGSLDSTKYDPKDAKLGMKNTGSVKQELFNHVHDSFGHKGLLPELIEMYSEYEVTDQKTLINYQDAALVIYFLLRIIFFISGLIVSKFRGIS